MMGITPKSYLITAHQIRLWPALTVRCIESEGGAFMYSAAG